MQLGLKLLVMSLGLATCSTPLSAEQKNPLSVRIVDRTANSSSASAVEHVELYGSSYALVIGNDAYTSGWPRLSAAVSDARLVADALESHGFEVTLKTDVTKKGLESALEEFIFGPGAQFNARLLIWFAGHGYTTDGEGYIAPVDATSDESGTASNMRRSMLSLRRFSEYMREARGRHVMAIFDSCFSGTVFSVARAKANSNLTKDVLLPVRQFVSSGEAKQLVSDDGAFQKLFVSAITSPNSGADANSDGYVTGRELGAFLSERITNLTNSKQIPRYGALREDAFSGGDFIFEVGGVKSNLRSAVAPDREASAKRLEDLIKEAQRLLKVLGYEVGPADGKVGQKTNEGIEAFLNDNKLPSPNIVGDQLLSQLRIATFNSNISPTRIASAGGSKRAMVASVDDDDDDDSKKRPIPSKRRSRSAKGESSGGSSGGTKSEAAAAAAAGAAVGGVLQGMKRLPW
jgi:hypothetical protein